MLNINVEDFDDGDGFNVELRAEGSDELIAIQLHSVIKRIAKVNPKIIAHMLKLETEESDD